MKGRQDKVICKALLKRLVKPNRGGFNIAIPIFKSIF